MLLMTVTTPFPSTIQCILDINISVNTDTHIVTYSDMSTNDFIFIIKIGAFKYIIRIITLWIDHTHLYLLSSALMPSKYWHNRMPYLMTRVGEKKL